MYMDNTLIDTIQGFLNGAFTIPITLTNYQMDILHILIQKYPNHFRLLQEEIEKIQNGRLTIRDVPNIVKIVVDIFSKIKIKNVDIYDIIEVISIMVVGILMENDLMNRVFACDAIDVIDTSIHLLKTNIETVKKVETTCCIWLDWLRNSI